MKVNLAFSPCPNDTYMMYALLHEKVDTMGFDFVDHIYDVEELNQYAIEGRFDVTKLSFRTFYDVVDQYDLLDAGAALGRSNGPLLIAKESIDIQKELVIAVPGLKTTATFLLKFAFPQVVHLRPMLFSDIEAAIESGEVDAGVIIHETRFMYAEHGFSLIADLGAEWERRTQMAIPLGGFVIRHEMEDVIKSKVNSIVQSSIAYASTHYDEVLDYMKIHAQELDNKVIKSHVDMFVNEYSMSLGDDGRNAIHFLFSELNQQQKKYHQPSII